MKKKNNLIVLGCTGFIGRNVIEYFASKNRYNVYGTYLTRKPWKNSKIKFIKADLTNKKQVKKVLRKMDIVIQAAATTSGAKDIVKKPFIQVTDNAVMNAYLFRNCYLNKVKHVIFFSCTTMYKSSKKPIKENNFNPLKDIEPKYFGVATTKVYNESICDFYSRIGQTKFTAIRHSNIYGPYDKYDLERSHVFGATVTKVMTAKKEIVVWGKGTEKRDLLHIDDLVSFIKLAIKKQKNKFELLNCGAGYSISINNLVKKIIKISQKKLKIKYDLSKPTIPTYLSVNCDMAKKKFGWKPKIKLDDGIKRTITWWKDNF